MFTISQFEQLAGKRPGWGRKHAGNVSGALKPHTEENPLAQWQIPKEAARAYIALLRPRGNPNWTRKVRDEESAG